MVTARLAAAGVEASVGSVGDSYDNAPGGDNHRPVQDGSDQKAGAMEDLGWRGVCDAGMGADWFNHRRLLAPIGNVPPAEYEKMYYDEFNRSCKAA